MFTRKNPYSAVLFLSLALASTSVWAAPLAYEIDASHSSVAFKVRHMMVSWVKGQFDKFSGTVTLDEATPSKGKVEVQIDPSSINTGIEKRDEHLRNADFFDVQKFPKMSYISKAIKKGSDGKLIIEGDLTMHGVTKPVTLKVTELTSEIKDPWGGMRRGVSAEAKLDRKDFGLTFNTVLETGGVAVGEEILISIELELTRKP